MAPIHKYIFPAVLSLVVVLSLSACSGSSSNGIAEPGVVQEDDTTTDSTDDSTDSGDSENTDITQQENTDNSSGDSVIASLDSLGPLQDRLYAGTTYGQQISGPVVGKALLTNSEIITEMPFEVIDKVRELEVEAVYVLRRYPIVSNALRLNRADPEIFVLVTNVSNKMMCDIRFRNVNVEFADGETFDASVEIRGFATIEDERFNFVSDRYAYDCIPPGLSAYARGDTGEFLTDFDELGDDENPVDVSDIVKVNFGELKAEIDENDVTDTTGLHASMYGAFNSSTVDFLATLVNPSDRTLDYFTSTIMFLDPETGVPIGTTTFFSSSAIESEFDGDIFTPGQEVSDYFLFRTDKLIGSTNTIMLFPEYDDANSQ